MNMEDVAGGGISQAQTQFSVLSGCDMRTRSARWSVRFKLFRFALLNSAKYRRGAVSRGMLEQQGVTGADQMNTIHMPMAHGASETHREPAT